MRENIFRKSWFFVTKITQKPAEWWDCKNLSLGMKIWPFSMGQLIRRKHVASNAVLQSYVLTLQLSARFAESPRGIFEVQVDVSLNATLFFP